jgi:cell division protein FtsA
LNTESGDREQNNTRSSRSSWSENRAISAIGKIVFGLDIGHSKCCIACGEADPRGFLSLIGFVERQLDPEMRTPFSQADRLIQILREMMIEFEKRYDVYLGAPEVAVSGKHITGETFSEGDEVSIPAGHEFLHRFRRWQDATPWWDFTSGHAIHGSRAALAEVVKVVERLPLKPQSLVFSGLASAYAVTRPQERWGAEAADVLTIDIGAGTTDYFLFRDGNVAKSGAIAAGGDLITSEIASKLKIPWRQAEEEKRAHNTVSPQREIIWQQIIGILTSVAENAPGRQGKFSIVYLTGGTSRIRNIERMAASVFDRPVYFASATNLTGLTEPRPEHSTVLGLLKYGYNRSKHLSMLNEVVTV